MKIIRFLNRDGQTCFGENLNDGYARLIRGDLFADFTLTDEKVRVAKHLAPINPSAILCIGLNYRHHAEEIGAKAPAHPILFMKNLNAVCHPFDPIIIPHSCTTPLEVDYEAELAVVLGRDVKNASAEEARQAIFGYTVANDVSARLWQTRKGGGQWVRGKSFDTFCPLGPDVVTADSIDDPQQLEIECLLNGEQMQNGNTSDMIFPVVTLIQELSRDTTLSKGTVILTGTPSGVGFTRTPPVYLKHGDTIQITIEKIGTLENPIRLPS